jgi:acyl-CoA dehydrogenase
VGSDFINSDSLYPLSFDVPGLGVAEYFRDTSVRLMTDFFRAKGLAALKEEDRQEAWYQDWIDYQAGHGLYASLLAPKQYSTRGHQFDIRRLTRFLEVFAYYSPAHGYSLHVSFLGLFPILLGGNEPLKREAIARLEAGGLFAFAVSERTHGSDLLANEFTIRPDGSGGFVAAGDKHYIGNVNAADLVSVLARKVDPAAAESGRRAPRAFVALRPRETPAFASLRKIRTFGVRAAYVGEFRVDGQAVPAADVISEGREAWDAAFATVDFGKFFLGFGAVGICERAFAEALAHLRGRVLYGKSVTDLSHIRAATAVAFARLTAMKLYATRSLDYLYAAGPDDRRYLLFNAVQKARVSTEGVKVLALLSECIGAKGFEADTYFEMALREAPMVPGLEGSTHINFALAAQFVHQYFADPADGQPGPRSIALAPNDAGENPYWLRARDRHPKTVRFPPCLASYRAHREVPNVRLFVTQVKAFRRFARSGAGAPAPDPALPIAIGRCFTAVAYGQLVAEGCGTAGADAATVSVVFQALIEDLAAESLRLGALFPAGSHPRALLRRMVRVPRATAADVEAVFASLTPRYCA